MDREVRHLRTMELRHQRQLTLQMAGNGYIAVFRALHTDGPTGVGNVNRFFCIASLRLVVDRRSIKRRKKNTASVAGFVAVLAGEEKGCPGRRGSRCVLTDVSAGQAEGIAILRVVKRRQLVALRFHRLGRRGDRRRQPGLNGRRAARRVPSRSGCPAPSRRRSALPDSS